MTCRAPVPPLDPLFDRWPAGEIIHVIHGTAYAPESFNPGVDAKGRPRNPTRFAPITDDHGRVVPYLYGGSTLPCAIFETVFHNVPIEAADKYVDLDDFGQRGHGQLVPKRDLRLADLTSEGLHRLKIPKEELITSPARGRRFWPQRRERGSRRPESKPLHVSYLECKAPTMRVSSKGQVTIPVEIRRLAGLHPGSEVEFAFRDGEIILRRADGKTRGQMLVERLQGVFSEPGMSADEIMRETRGED